MLAAVTGTWAAIFSAHALAFRAGSPLLALLPPVALVAFADTVLEEFVRPALRRASSSRRRSRIVFADGAPPGAGMGPGVDRPGREARPRPRPAAARGGSPPRRWLSRSSRPFADPRLRIEGDLRHQQPRTTDQVRIDPAGLGQAQPRSRRARRGLPGGLGRAVVLADGGAAHVRRRHAGSRTSRTRAIDVRPDTTVGREPPATRRSSASQTSSRSSPQRPRLPVAAGPLPAAADRCARIRRSLQLRTGGRLTLLRRAHRRRRPRTPSTHSWSAPTPDALREDDASTRRSRRPATPQLPSDFPPGSGPSRRRGRRAPTHVRRGHRDPGPVERRDSEFTYDESVPSRATTPARCSTS